MTDLRLTFDAVSEDLPGQKWAARWARSWPAYKAWFIARGGDTGPCRAACEAALADHMPELVPVHVRLTGLAGGTDRAARFLSTWCPPAYLGGCSIAAVGNGRALRLIRNYDLSPDLNEGLLLRSVWTGRPVMGMVEFLWGLSDGINADGLSVALAFGGTSRVAPGFGITTILRYILETCGTVAEALAVLDRIPSHMDYNLVLAERGGARAGVEMVAGGGARRTTLALATNHQLQGAQPDRPGFTATYRRHALLADLPDDGPAAAQRFLDPGLFQTGHKQGFGTLFTAVYDPYNAGLDLRWQGESWSQTLANFTEGSRTIRYDAAATVTPAAKPSDHGATDWSAFAAACSRVETWDAETWRRLLAA